MHQIRGEVECTCGPKPEEPNKSIYFAKDRTPRLLSEVLTSVAKVQQIDHLPEELLKEKFARKVTGGRQR
jgi:hypothetical protein